MARDERNRSVSPFRRRNSPFRRERSRGGESPARDGDRGRARHERSVSPENPRTKRLRRVQAERGDERERRRPARDDGDGDGHGDGNGEKSNGRRRPGRDEGDHRSRNERVSRSRSPARPRDEVPISREAEQRSRNKRVSRSRSPARPRDEVPKSREAEQRSRNKRVSRSRSRSPLRPRDEEPKSRDSEQRNEEDDPVSKMEAAEKALAEKKEKPSFELSGKLAAETNRVRGITLLFNEPSEAAKPDIRWRLYVFKNGEALNEPLYIHRQSCYLFGRERRVADIPTDHPSCSKQHAVIQYRKVEFEKPDGMLGKKVKCDEHNSSLFEPYIMDLGSTNKTFLNDAPIEPQRYYELREQDTIKFGNSSREYVLLHENSA